MSGAGAALLEAARAALGAVDGLSGIFEPGPVQSANSHATIEVGPESDWSHKSGAGRELLLAIVIRTGGERSGPVRVLADKAEAAVAAMGGEVGGWRVVGMQFLRSRTLRDGRHGWTAVSEFRARMMRL